jgi:hypothetical protein
MQKCMAGSRPVHGWGHNFATKGEHHTPVDELGIPHSGQGDAWR